MEEDRCWLLVSLSLSGEATPAEGEELQALLAGDPMLQLQFREITALWQELPLAAASTQSMSFARHWQRLREHPGFAGPGPDPGLSPAVAGEEAAGSARQADLPVLSSGSTASRRTIRKVGAAAAILLVAGLFFLYHPGSSTELAREARNIITTRRGSRTKVQLPDGSQVWLNADSRLVYGEAFKRGTREVELFGEAFFDVTRDTAHPFVIHTESMTIRVLGTAFNVRSYGNETTSETALFRGKVEVRTKSNPETRIILKPNEKLITVNGQVHSDPSARPLPAEATDAPLVSIVRVHYQDRDSIATETAWLKNTLSFDNETMADIALRLERWYDVSVIVRGAELNSTRFSGTFRDESLAEVVEALRLTGNFHFTIDRKNLTITP